MGPFTEFFQNLPLVEMTEEVQPREFTNKETGQRERNGVNQLGYLVQRDHRGVELRRTIRIPRGREQSPFAPGQYVLSGASLNGNQYGDLEMRRFSVDLVPVPPVVNALLDQEAKRG